MRVVGNTTKHFEPMADLEQRRKDFEAGIESVSSDRDGGIDYDYTFDEYIKQKDS